MARARTGSSMLGSHPVPVRLGADGYLAGPVLGGAL